MTPCLKPEIHFPKSIILGFKMFGCGGCISCQSSFIHTIIYTESLDLFRWWLFTFYHGKSPFFTTIWEKIFGIQASKSRKSKNLHSLHTFVLRIAFEVCRWQSVHLETWRQWSRGAWWALRLLVEPPVNMHIIYSKSSTFKCNYLENLWYTLRSPFVGFQM